MTQQRIDLTSSKKIGRYVGPVLSVLFLSEVVTLPIFTTPASEHIVYLNGFVLFVFGFYVLTVHNVWTKQWPLLITLSGWAMTSLGLYRLFFPTATQAPVDAATYIMIVLFLVVQLFVTVKSYMRG